MPSTLINPPDVSVGTTELLVGRSHDASIHLSEATISRSHATISRQTQGILIVDHDSRYGTYKNGQPIRREFLRPGDRVRFGEKLTYRVTQEGLKFEPKHEGCSLVVRGLQLDRETVVTLFDRLAAETQSDETKIAILKNVCFEIATNEFVGLLAPSGGGKSTLLEALSGYLRPTTGTINCDGKFDIYQELQRYTQELAFVPQKDELYAKLTVRENLRYAATLRMDNSVSEEQVDFAVKDTLNKVGLAEHSEKYAENLSGGQAKRLSVAMELIRSPRLLLLDEPCAGLDPASEAKLMELLRVLARQGTTIICSTHMLESMLWFDRIIILGKSAGHSHSVLAYDGSPQPLLGHFGCRQFADLYDKLEAGHFEPITGNNAAESPSATAEKASALVTTTVFDQDRWLHQWVCQADRLGLSILRGEWRTLVLQPLFLGCLVCLTQYRVKADDFLRFFLVVVAIWLGLNNSIREIVDKRRLLYLRDRLIGVMPSSFFCSKVFIYLVVGVVQLFLLFLVYRLGRWVILEGSTVSELGSLWADLGLFSGLLIAYSGGLAIGLGASSFAISETQAVGWLPLLLMPQLLLSAVATGVTETPYSQGRGFQPVVAWVSQQNAIPSSWSGKSVEWLSLLTISRPTTLVVEAPLIEKKSQTGDMVPLVGTWVGDVLHLLLITAIYWSLSFWLFVRGDRQWIQLKELR